MDSMNPNPPNSPSFVNLLTSQLVNEIYPHTIELGSSELFEFSSQCSDDPSVAFEDRKEMRKWSLKLDIFLINAWLNTSKDPVVGNEQKAGAFLKRIQAYLNSSPQMVGEQPREWRQCKQQWNRINDHVCNFLGCYEAAKKEKASGQNDNDLMKAAHEIFFNDHLV
ncbi:glutathione S-transferase T3-like [Eutrema salsugineum]|uniref:glutathione S-transferase T3-like n=1 Tax=Eutrema salsugineum TaxID=72664 RepID=UPI000CECF599|nr:glutathione S-transferase T3-like [Eutrema salsugineum]